MYTKHRAALALMLARDSLLSCHRLARHLVDDVDGAGTTAWQRTYAQRVELFESMMRCLIDYGMRPGDLQEKLRTVPTEEKVAVDLAAVIQAEGKLERRLDYFLRGSLDDPELQRLLVKALADVRSFRELTIARQSPGAITVPVDRSSHQAGRTLESGSAVLQ